MGATKQKRAWDQQTTTDAYADLGTEWDVSDVAHVGLGVAEVGSANGIDYQVLGSYDDGSTFPATVVAEQSVAAGTRDDQAVDVRPWTHIKIQVKATVASNQGDVTAQAVGYEES